VTGGGGGGGGGVVGHSCDFNKVAASVFIVALR